MTKERMMKLMTSVDDLFTTQEERDMVKQGTIVNIPLTQIDPFPNHPFQVRMDAAMEKLVDSVARFGVLNPALVRPQEDGRYQLVSGHRRQMASELAGKDSLSCIVRELMDEEATIIMVDTNIHREYILPSEKAFAYKMKLEAMKRQGQRTDRTSDPVGWKFSGLESAAIVGKENGDGQTQVRRYIRLTNLIPELLALVDNSVQRDKSKPQIAMRPAVELSYLTEQEQSDLYDAITAEDCTPSHAQAIKMRQFSEQGRLGTDVIYSIMQETKPNQREYINFSKERLSQFFEPGTPTQDIVETVVAALELYRKRQRSKER